MKHKLSLIRVTTDLTVTETGKEKWFLQKAILNIISTWMIKVVLWFVCQANFLWRQLLIKVVLAYNSNFSWSICSWIFSKKLYDSLTNRSLNRTHKIRVKKHSYPSWQFILKSVHGKVTSDLAYHECQNSLSVIITYMVYTTHSFMDMRMWCVWVF